MPLVLLPVAILPLVTGRIATYVSDVAAVNGLPARYWLRDIAGYGLNIYAIIVRFTNRHNATMPIPANNATSTG